MAENTITKSVLTEKDLERLSHHVDYLAGLTALADPNGIGGEKPTILREELQALLRVGREQASDLYVDIMASLRDGEEGGEQ